MRTESATEADFVLGGRYVVRKLIGAGGSATVHRADDRRLGRPVAVKLLHPHLLADPAVVAAFLHEARVAAGLNHPGIVAVHDVGEDVVAGGAIPWMVLELVEGRTVRQLLASDGPFRPEHALTIIAGVLDALGHSHRRGVIHRDVSPGNVMLAADGTVKVADFGIAAAVGVGVQDDAVRGTAAYLSPEQARNAELDARSDLYSAGCLLFAMLTGRPPFTADTAADLAWEHVREEPPAPSTVNPDLPAKLDPVVLRALAKSPNRRYPDAASMRRAVIAARDRLTGTTAVPAVPVSVPVPEPAPTRVERPLPPAPSDAPKEQPAERSGVVVFVVVALAILLGVGIWWSVPRNDAPSRIAQAESVVVPALAGLEVDDAVARLQAAGLRDRRRTIEANETIPAGRVIRTMPAAGARVAKQRAIDLVVSGGSSRTQVPNVVNATRDQARSALAAARLRLGSVTERDSPLPAGTVLEASPAAGTVVVPGSVVDVVVASGWSVVPEVRGRPLEEGRRAVHEAGLRTRTASGGTGPAGTVVERIPGPAAGCASARRSSSTSRMRRLRQQPFPLRPRRPDPPRRRPRRPRPPRRARARAPCRPSARRERPVLRRFRRSRRRRDVVRVSYTQRIPSGPGRSISVPACCNSTGGEP